MTRTDLIRRIWEAHPSLYRREVEALIDNIFDEIAAALSRGERVELRGFGTFTLRRREARVGRNQRTGASVQVTAKRIRFFRPGRGLRDRINAR